MKIGETVRKCREMRAWTQEEFAYKVKTTAANISRIENGKHGPGAELLESIAYVFGMKVYQLIALAEGEALTVAAPEYNHEEALLLECFRALPVEERQLLRAVGESFRKLATSAPPADTPGSSA